ncbi:MAG TPA: ATP-grasp domain-containing protein, partial [Planctomycetota bacterium]|nr:ATP-grasp domain-containing protein [Planctomycetota bacterium]
GGLVFREFVELEPVGRHPKSGMPLTREHRVFYLDGRPLLSFAYWSDLGQTDEGPPAGVFEAVAKQVRSRFFTMDVVKLKDGDWLIVELGDGQVAGLPEDSIAGKLYGALAAKA